MTVVSGLSSAETLVVDESDPSAYDDIQSAVDDASAGATIQVEPGTYTGEVYVPRPLTLLGDPGRDAPGAGPDAPVLDGEGTTTSTAINPYDPAEDDPVEDVTVRGFEIRNYGRAPRSGEWGRALSGGPGSDGLTVADNTIADVGSSGIASFSDGRRTYEGWTVVRNRIEDASGQAIRLEGVRDCLVRDNHVVAGGVSGEDFRTDTRSNVGISLKASASDGNSHTISGVEVASNTIEGPFQNAGVYVLAINDNPSDSGTTAAVNDVSIHDNVARGLSADAEFPTKAFRLSANALDGGSEGQPPRCEVRNVRFEDNVAEDGDVGFATDTNGREAIADVTYRGNVVRNNEQGVTVGGFADRAIRDVSFSENRITGSDWFGVFTHGSAPLESVEFHRNDIYDNGDAVQDMPAPDGTGVLHTAPGTLSMPCTFWGHPTGPSTEENENGKGEVVYSTSGDVAVEPWARQSFERVPEEACHGGQNDRRRP